MVSTSKVIHLDSSAPVEILDITGPVGDTVRTLGLREGLVNVMALHTTAAIRIGESEPGLFSDIAEFLARVAPPGKGYRHDRTPVDSRRNAHGHIAAFLLGTSEGIAVHEGKLLLGSWQRVFFVELDGPRRGRTVVITVVGE